VNESDEALRALRDIDGPQDVPPDVMGRIESRMLDRFDEVAGASSSVPDIELVEFAREEAAQPPARWRRPLLVAAAVVAFVAGLAVVIDRRSDDEQVPVTEPTLSVEDLEAVEEQIARFCADQVVWVTATSELWEADETGESRRNHLIAIEEAAQALESLPPPAGPRVAATAQRLLEIAAEARIAESVGIGETEAIREARDSLYFFVAALPGAEGVEECGPS